MTSILVIGGGKAGALHYRAYSRLARSGVLRLDRVSLLDRRGAPGAELAGLVREAGACLPTYASWEELAAVGAPDPARTVVDLCLPSSVLVDVLLEAWRAGYRRFVVEKPFVVLAEDEQRIRPVLETSAVFLVRNYLFSRVHRLLQGMMADHELEPLVCVTDFSKDRRADAALGRGAGPGRPPTVFEIEIPHQLYVGADLVGAPATLDHVEAHDMHAGTAVVPHQGRGVLVGRSETGCVFVHHSDLEHPRVVRTLDVVCADRFSLQAIYAPICEELRDAWAGVVLAKGDRVLDKRVFTEDDNMTATMAAALRHLTGDEPARVSLADVVQGCWPLRVALEACDTLADASADAPPGAPAGASAGAPAPGRSPATATSGLPVRRQGDLVQDWFARSFSLGLERGVAADLLGLLEERRRARFSAVLAGMDPRGAVLAGARRPAGAPRSRAAS